MKYQKGDIITHEEFKDRKILSVVDELYFISRRDHRLSEMMYTEYELDEIGYTLKSRPKEDWTPEKHEKYYYISNKGVVNWTRWENDETDSCISRYSGIFKTIEQSEERLYKIKEFIKTL
jgi:hypothetical protein